MIAGKDVQLVCNTTGTGVQETFTFQLGHSDKSVLQCEISATATFTLEVRLSPDAPWFTLGAAVSTQTSFALTQPYPQLRVNVSANTGTLKVWVMS